MSVVKRVRIAEFICPECGHVNRIQPQLLMEKYREHEVSCAACNHKLEVVVADGISDSLNIIASSKEEPSC